MRSPPGHTIIPCDARQAILYSMRSPPGHFIHHAMLCIVRPYHILCHARQAKPFSCHARQAIAIQCHAHQAIPHTMPCPLGQIIYHASQDIQYTMPCQAIPYTMPFPPGHTIYLTMPVRSYHIPCHTTSVNHVTKARWRTVSLRDARLLVNRIV